MADLFWYFILYSFLGFLIEVVYVRLIRHPKRDRKCLYLLPLCPVYGLGAVLILLLPPALRAHPILFLPAAALVCTAVEFFVGLFYEKVALVSFWDYSHLPGNLCGRICPFFSLAWGGLAMLLIYLLHPLAARLVPRIPPALTLLVGLLFLADTLFTLRLLRRERTTEALRWYRRPTPPICPQK